LIPDYITSESNSRIRHLKALRDRKDFRYAERLFIVEGPRFVDDALVFALPKLLVLSERRANEENQDHYDFETIVVPDSLFAKVSDTRTPQGVMAIFPFPDPPMDYGRPLLDVVADGIQDPGNLGTLIRSAATLGATRVVITPGTVDPFGPKVVRAAASSLFQIPIVFTSSLADEIGSSAVWLADGRAQRTIDQVDWTVPSAIIVGSEGNGAVSDLSGLDYDTVSIPSHRPVESLNAGVAASIVLYESLRQRRQARV
jgi:TrmH family RNA methyltransferase